MKLLTFYNLLYNTFMNVIGYPLFRILKSDQANNVKINKRLKNLYEGERCFILGNGPSLNDVNLADLKDEYVFTVNQLMRRKDFSELRTDFHLWSDFNFFDLDMDRAEDVEILEIMRKVNTKDNKPLCFFPADMLNFAKKYGLDKELNINYFKIRLRFHEGFNKNINFAKFIPGMSTVVHFAIFLAVYLGFKEIYLLGCDTTSIVVQIKSSLDHNDENDYSYDLSENEKKRMHNLLIKNGIEGYARSFWHMLLSYRVLYQYCKKRKVSLYNCSSQTIIDTIPKKKLSAVLERSVSNVV